MRRTIKGARPLPPRRAGSAFVALSTLVGPAVPAEGAIGAQGPPCHLCTARCCKYFALAIDTPITPQDHDYVRWFLMHEHVVVWRQDGDWYLEVRTPCRHLRPDGACGVYDARPQVCRDYGLPDTAEDPAAPCEYFDAEATYDLFFGDAESFEAWSRVELAKREARLARRRARRREKIDGEGTREAIA